MPLGMQVQISDIYNKSTANRTKYARQIFEEAMILTFD
jgi:hypothetical protein